MTHKQASTIAAGKTKAVLYARVSTKDQEKEGYSIPAQIELLEKYAEREGMEILHQYIDVETAKQAGRSEFGKMTAFLAEELKKGGPGFCKTVLVEKTDRLYRNLKDWVTLDDLKLTVCLVKENTIISPDSRSSEKLFHGIKVLMAKNYCENLGEEASKGMLQKAKEGMWPSYSPIGYRNVTNVNGKNVIEPDPETAPLVLRLYQEVATGQYCISQAVDLATDMGLRNRKPPYRKLVRSQVHKMLRQLVYTGDFEWKGEYYQGNYEAIVPKELYDEVQKVLDNRRTTNRRQSPKKFAYAQLVTCGHCGGAMSGSLHKGKYVYYRCSGYRSKGKCPERNVREKVLDKLFVDLLAKLHFDDEILGWVVEALKESHSTEKEFHADAVKRLQRRYDNLQKKLHAMYEDKLSGLIGDDMFKGMAEGVRKEQDECMGAIAKHQNAEDSYLDLGVTLLNLANNAVSLFKSQSSHEKRRLLNLLLCNCSFKEGSMHPTWREPFDMIAEAAEGAKQKQAADGEIDGLRSYWLPRTDLNRQPSG